MPHVIVKLYQGRSEEQKARLAAEIVTDVVDVLNSADESVSLAIEDVKPGERAEKVYRTDILGNWDKLYKKPGYSGALLSASVRKRSPRSWSTTSCRSSMIPEVVRVRGEQLAADLVAPEQLHEQRGEGGAQLGLEHPRICGGQLGYIHATNIAERTDTGGRFARKEASATYRPPAPSNSVDLSQPNARIGRLPSGLDALPKPQAACSSQAGGTSSVRIRRKRLAGLRFARRLREVDVGIPSDEGADEGPEEETGNAAHEEPADAVERLLLGVVALRPARMRQHEQADGASQGGTDDRPGEQPERRPSAPAPPAQRTDVPQRHDVLAVVGGAAHELGRELHVAEPQRLGNAAVGQRLDLDGVRADLALQLLDLFARQRRLRLHRGRAGQTRNRTDRKHPRHVASQLSSAEDCVV